MAYPPERCTCDDEEHEPHSCPYAEELGNGEDCEDCTCCPYCASQCWADI